ncbi:MAG: anti-sigma factor family protein [Thermoguttaceae bacterium]
MNTKRNLSSNIPDADIDSLELVDDQEQDAFDDDLDTTPLDETELQIAAWLDGELDEEERAEFEKRLENDPQLRARVESEKNALDALNLIDDDKIDPDSQVVDKTVEKLNAQTQSELNAIQTEKIKRRRTAFLAQGIAFVVLCVLGFEAFNLFFPNVEKRRREDAPVVERLQQLESVGTFEYLVALDQSHILDLWRQTQKEAFEIFAPPFEKKNESAPCVANRTYDELLQDRVFYRLQRRFESMDPRTQEKWRVLSRQINEAPNSASLLMTLDDYSAWLVLSLQPDERDRLEGLPISERLREIRRRVLDWKKTVNAFKFSQLNKGDEANAASSADAVEPQPKLHGPTSLLRASLPSDLQKEDLRPIYSAYLQYRDAMQKAPNLNNRREDVLEFIATIDKEKLFSKFSPESRKWLEELEPEKQSSIIGLLVSISFIENAERPFVPMRPFQNEEGARNMRDPSAVDSVQNLAATLRKASQEERDLITSCPIPEARGRLIGLAWLNHNRFNSQGEKTSFSREAPPQRNAAETGGGRGPRFKEGFDSDQNSGKGMGNRLRNNRDNQ